MLGLTLFFKVDKVVIKDQVLVHKGGIILKKIFRLFILLIIVVSSILYIFRWEKGPEQDNPDSTILHKRDIWNNQGWVKLYGTVNENYYSGDERPVFSKDEIDQYTEKILSSSTFQIRKGNIDLENSEIKANQQKLENYINVVNDILANYKKNTLNNWVKEWSFELETEMAIRDIRNCNEIGIPTQFQNIIEKGVSSPIIQEYNEYCNSKVKDIDVFNDTNEMESEARDLALDELTSKAMEESKKLTYIWSAIMVISILLFTLTFFRKPKMKEIIAESKNL
jgi:hypothetical protein